MQLRGRIYCGVYTVAYILWHIYWTVYVGVCIGAVADSVVFPAGSAYRCTVAVKGSEIFFFKNQIILKFPSWLSG